MGNLDLHVLFPGSKRSNCVLLLLINILANIGSLDMTSHVTAKRSGVHVFIDVADLDLKFTEIVINISTGI